MAEDHRGVDAELAQEVLLEDPGFLKEIVQRVLQELSEAQMTEHIGAAHYERGSARTGQRNGYEPRTLRTGVGTLNLLVPQDREGTFSTRLFSRYQRNEKALVLALMEMYVEGVSTRKVGWAKRAGAPAKPRAASRGGYASASWGTSGARVRETDRREDAWAKGEVGATPGGAGTATEAAAKANRAGNARAGNARAEANRAGAAKAEAGNTRRGGRRAERRGGRSVERRGGRTAGRSAERRGSMNGARTDARSADKKAAEEAPEEVAEEAPEGAEPGAASLRVVPLARIGAGVPKDPGPCD